MNHTSYHCFTEIIRLATLAREKVEAGDPYAADRLRESIQEGLDMVQVRLLDEIQKLQYQEKMFGIAKKTVEESSDAAKALAEAFYGFLKSDFLRSK